MPIASSLSVNGSQTPSYISSRSSIDTINYNSENIIGINNKNTNIDNGSSDSIRGNSVQSSAETTFHDCLEVVHNDRKNPDSFHENEHDPNDHPINNNRSSGPSSPEGEPVSDIKIIREKCGTFVDDERTQLFVLILIAINSIMTGIATSSFVKEEETLINAFDTFDTFVVICFTIETLLQFIYNGPDNFFKDGWLVFDFTIVVLSWITNQLSVLRALRFVTQISILRNVVVALLSIVPSIAAIFTLLMLIFYIFAVMFTALFKDLYAMGYTSEDYFGRLDYSLFTLFQFLCFDEWSGIGYEVAEYAEWSWVIMVAFVVMSAFVVVNLLIAVICDALQILRTAEVTMMEVNLNSTERDNNEGEVEIHHFNNNTLQGGAMQVRKHNRNAPQERMRERVNDMQKMIDEMIVTQSNMSKTIQYLSLALYAERKTDGLGCIREITTDELSRSLSQKSLGEREGGCVHRVEH
mmetsp:Transcript_5324/g.10449  ORF Transcript_5324/g.10449 Transcript_5324/m.10449 type:complete len:467 (-) Transcript_5324:233-1633(-)|eukprot:CAMPEP_0196155624 /NCGR_PEP_ID=MMETSP0910-20130528/40986_1 /TAXON_ID=49265 /ORGANISM="Thalassiosira rotula, Strain GSO102" /LENGTH=466 /DNA_ID=CAMNT_0041419889 /DNA_START=93 /DNA_END=1493 /DNA_ORIENTATION=-